MEYRRLGRSGLHVSALSLGSWVTFGHQLDRQSALSCMSAAYHAGVNFFDSAEVYAYGEAERMLGEALKHAGWPRDSVVLSSKVMWGSVPDPRPTQRGLSRKHIVEACDQALRRLQVDYLDLYFCHRPDPDAPIEETVRAMSELIWRGKVLYWGTSEWPVDTLREAYQVARQIGAIPPTMEQPQYNMFHRHRVEVEYTSLADTMGLGLTTWSPLAAGFLTGKYNDGIPPESRAALPAYAWLGKMVTSEIWQERIPTIRALSAVARELGTTLPRLAIAWCLKNPHVSSVITGASRVEQVEDNMRAIEVLPLLGGEVMATLSSILGVEAMPPDEPDEKGEG